MTSIQTQNEKYQGYTNAQTFLISLYLNNTKEYQDAVLNIFRDCPDRLYDAAIGVLISKTKSFLPNVNMLDHWAWNDKDPWEKQVDWDQIAQELIQSIKEGA